MAEVVIKVDGMSCQGCVRNITGVLTAMAGVETASVSLEAGVARVVYDPATVGVDGLKAAIEDAGFDAS